MSIRREITEYDGVCSRKRSVPEAGDSAETEGTLIIGRIGKDMSQEEGKLAARQVGLAILATLKKNLGSLNKIKRVIKVLGMVNCVTEFERHPFVINGCSELFASVWGEDNGIGVRSAVGMGSLPDNIPWKLKRCSNYTERKNSWLLPGITFRIQMRYHC